MINSEFSGSFAPVFTVKRGGTIPEKHNTRMQYSQWCKLAFLCNVCFLCTLAAHFVSFIPDSALGSSVIILGQLVAVFLNIFVNGWLAVRWFKNGRNGVPEPVWIPIVNFIILLMQGYYYFFFNL